MAEKKSKESAAESSGPKRIAVVRVRGAIKAMSTIRDTLEMLNLHAQNHCVVLDNTPDVKGMVMKVKDYVTWGEISEETYNELLNKRSQAFTSREGDSKGLIKYNYSDMAGKKIKKCFRLSPPRKGYEKKGIKKSFRQGGALGYRGDKINNLIKRML